MVNLTSFRADIDDEVSTILASDFTVSMVKTVVVPHSLDGAITYPNLDEKKQSTKVIETAVLYIDMRRSTELSLTLKPHTVAKLYSTFIRSMARCADHYGGKVRGIVGDRVMVLFDSANCYTQAIDTAILMNSVCKYIINRHFNSGDVTFGIGIDFGRMLATKTGITKKGHTRHNYQSLVWLGRPANIASKLTDMANKAGEYKSISNVRIGFAVNVTGEWTWIEQSFHEFTNFAKKHPNLATWTYKGLSYMSHIISDDLVTIIPETPPILISKRFYDGLVSARPDGSEIKHLKKIGVKLKDHPTDVYGGDIIFPPVKG